MLHKHFTPQRTIPASYSYFDQDAEFRFSITQQNVVRNTWGLFDQNNYVIVVGTLETCEAALENILPNYKYGDGGIV